MTSGRSPRTTWRDGEPGSPGYRRAAEFVAARFAALGLEPAGEDGYFQTVRLEGRVTGESPNVVARLRGSDLAAEHVVLTAHLDDLGIGPPVEGDGICNGALDNAAGVAALLDIAAELRRRGRQAEALDPVRDRHRRGNGPARLALVRAPADRAARHRSSPNLNYDMALPLFPLRSVWVLGAEESSLGRWRAAVGRAMGLPVAPRSVPGAQLVPPLRPIFLHRGGIPAIALQVRLPPRLARGRDRATPGARAAITAPATMRRRPCSARTRSGCTISSPRLALRVAECRRAAALEPGQLLPQAVRDDEEVAAPRLAAARGRPGGAALAAARAGRGDRRRRCRARRRCGRCGCCRTTTGCAARRAFAPPPRRSATGCATTGSRGSRSSRCPPTARSSTAPSARGPAGTRASPNCGKGGSGSPPGPSSRSASPRTASRGRAEAELVDIGAGTTESRLSGQGGARPAGADLLAARGGAGARRRPLRRGRDRLLGAEPAHRLVGRGREPGPLGPSRHLLRRTRPSPSWSRRRGRAPGRSGCGAARAVRLRAEVDAGPSPSAYLIPTAVIPGRRRDPGDRLFLPPRPSQSRAPTTMPPAARASSRSRGRLNRLIAQRRAAAAGADAPLHLAGRDRRHDRPAQRPARIRPADAGDDPSRHDRRRYRDHQVDPARRRLAAEPAELRHPTSASPSPATSTRSRCAYRRAPARRTCRCSIPTASRRALQAEIGGFSEGSDHQVWAEGSWRIPVIYIADWPDRYIHTQRDVPGQSRSHQDAPRDLHRRGFRLLSRDP